MTKSLRLASTNLRANFNLSRTDYLCTDCRKKLNLLDNEEDKEKAKDKSSESDCNDTNSDEEMANLDDELSEPINDTLILRPSNYFLPKQNLYCFFFLGTNSLSSHEIASQLSSLSQLSINTQLPTINDTFTLLNQSPIPNNKLTHETYLKDKIGNVTSYLSTAFGLEKDLDAHIKAQEFSNMIDALKMKFHDEKTNRKEQVQILTLLPPDWTVYKVCNIMHTTRDMVKVAKSLREKWGILSMPESKPGEWNHIFQNRH